MQRKAYPRVGVKIWMRCLMNIKIHQRNPSKKKKKELLNILEAQDSYVEPDEIMLKFKQQN